ncbi:MAG: LysR family transcriptional regulator substrate-binding protein, partial [Eubacteriales bacterium]
VAFKKQYPGVVVNLVEAESIRIQKLLFSGELDLIIDNYNYSESLYKKTLFSQETLLLAVPKAMIQKEHEEYLLTAEDIAKKKHLNPESKAVELSMFNGFPFIALRYGNDTRERLECIRKTQEFRPNVVLELDQLATAYHVACNGLGMTITSDTLVNETPADGRLVYFCLKSEEIHRENYFYYKQGKYVSQAMKVFMEFSANMTKNT